MCLRAGMLTILALAVAGSLLAAPRTASAVSMSVRTACFNDYLAHCSSHALGSPGLRRCMRAVGARLSKRCIGALIAAGEVSEREIFERASAIAGAR